MNEIKLNLGCGSDIKEGYINIDNRMTASKIINLKEYENHDLDTPLPFDDYKIDYILAKDILEHFSWRDTNRIFTDWVRVLKIGGKMDLLVPNFDAHYKLYKEGKTDARYKEAWGYFVANVFGGQDYEGNFHKTMFIKYEVESLFERCGLDIIKMEVAKRYIKAVGVKI